MRTDGARRRLPLYYSGVNLTRLFAGEIWRFVALLIGAVFIGLFAGHVLLLLFLTVTAFLGWQLYNLFKLEQWFSLRRKQEPPESEGVWGEVFEYLLRQQRGNRKRKEKLVSLLTRFREAASALPDAVVILRGDDSIDWFNDAAKRLLGLHAPKDTGQQIVNLVRNPVFIEFLRAGDFAQRVEFSSPASEDIALNVMIVPYGKDQRLLIARDITHLQRLEQTRRDFVANVSHELRTPLTVVNGYVEVLADSNGPGLDPWRSQIQLMQTQTLRMQRIVEDLLMLSQLENQPGPAPERTVAIPALLENLRGEARVLSGENGHIITLEVDATLWLKGVESEIVSAFSNLITNAVRYTPAGGRITLRWFRDSHGAHLSVADSGVGVPPSDIPRLTERFYRVDAGRSRNTGGTGLGLAIVKHALSRHGATLRIESVLEKGSVFTCDFPLTRVLNAARG